MTIPVPDRLSCGPRLDVWADRWKGRTLVRLEGEVDLNSAGKLRDFLLGLDREGHRALVVDLGGVRFIDTLGLNVLRSAAKRAREHGGSLRLMCSRARATWLFAFVPPPAEVPICESLRTASAAD